MNITQNIFFFMNVFLKIRKFLQGELHYKFSQFQESMTILKELLGYISQLGSVTWLHNYLGNYLMG